MSALNRKLLRDLLHLRGQVTAIILVVTCGVAVVVTSRTAYESLRLSQANYYAAYRFADVFTSLKRAPQRLVSRIESIPGVAAVRDRIVFDVTLDVPGLSEPATGRLVSMPERRTPVLNDVYLRRGRYLEAGRRDEVIASEAFAEANGLEVGDSVGAILNGRWQRLRLVGIGLSPEYIYEIQGTSLFPDNKRFGVLWMSEEAMGPAFDMEGAFNDLVLSLTPGAREEEVIARLDRLLEPYGGLGAFGRAEHISHTFISDEIRQNRVFGTILPLIFLGVAAFLLNVVLSRLVSTQRDQIGTLKAFGYGRRAIALHYFNFALVAVVMGAVLGTGIGLWLGALINRLYGEFYRFPLLSYEAGPDVIALAVGVSSVAAFLGAVGAARRAYAITPAVAMRAEAPTRFRSGLLERLGMQRWLSPPARIIFRNLTRQPLRAFLSTLGIALAVAILVLGRYFVDAIEHIAEVQFRLVQREDVNVTAQELLPSRARHELARLPGVLRTEPYRVVPVRLRFGHRSRRSALMGLSRDSELRQLVGRRREKVPVPAEGVVLTAKLADILGVSVGDPLTVEVLEGQRPTRTVAVSGTVDELIGLAAYMEVRALNRLMREGGVLSGGLLAIDPLHQEQLYRTLKQLPAVGGVNIREAALESFKKTIGESLGIFTTVIVAFACVIAVAVVYNAARIALSERGRELASLRVLGFTRGEITVMLLGEHALLTATAIPLGYLLGYQASAAMARAYQWELFRLPLFVSRETYVFAFVVVLGAALLSAAVVRGRLNRLDLVAVLKTRE
jgi:putative ABC transport system permease protein